MIAALIICLALLLVLGVPVAFAIGLSGMAALIVNGQIPFEIIPQRRASRLSSYPTLEGPHADNVSNLIS